MDAAASARVRIRRADYSVSDFGACGRTALKRTAKACGPGARCWRQVGGGVASPTGSCKTVNSPMTVTRRIRRRGERAISRQTIAQGRPVVSAATCMLVCAFSCSFCARDRGCQPAPGLSCALCFKGGENSPTTRAQRAARMQRRVQFRHCEEQRDEAIQLCCAAKLDYFAPSKHHYFSV